MIAVYFAVSVILGYLVLYSINLVVWLTSFWYFEVFSFVTIKDAAIMILSGALMPIWFMPGWMYNIVQVTPFGSIYSCPYPSTLASSRNRNVYKISFAIGMDYRFPGIARLMWHCAVKRIVVQGDNPG